MAGEIQLNSTSFASESGGTITINNATVGSAVAMSANQACVKTAINASGSAPIYACRAWINFDGTSASIGTGRANGNVSGVNDHGTGQYTITFASAMPDANYAIAGMVSNTTDSWANDSTTANRGPIGIFQDGETQPSTTACRIQTRYGSTASSDGANLDFSQVTIAIFR